MGAGSRREFASWSNAIGWCRRRHSARGRPCAALSTSGGIPISRWLPLGFLAVPYAITAKTLPSLDALNGIPCKAQTPAAGSLTLTFGLNGVVTMSCGPLFTLTVTTTGGSNPAPPVVTSNPAGISCNGFGSNDCTEAYLGGTVVTLTTASNALYLFTCWSGACTGTGPCVVTMDAARSVTASFQLQL